MQYLQDLTNNCWQTLRKKLLRPYSKKMIWWVFKLSLLLARLILKLIDLFFGEFPND